MAKKKQKEQPIFKRASDFGTSKLSKIYMALAEVGPSKRVELHAVLKKKKITSNKQDINWVQNLPRNSKIGAQLIKKEAHRNGKISVTAKGKKLAEAMKKPHLFVKKSEKTGRLVWNKRGLALQKMIGNKIKQAA